MPKKFPLEFKHDVVTVARRGDLTMTEVAADFDVPVESVRRWMRQADIDDGVQDGLTSAEQSEVVRCGATSVESAQPSGVTLLPGTPQQGAASRWRTRSCAVRLRTSRRTRSQSEVPAGP